MKRKLLYAVAAQHRGLLFPEHVCQRIAQLVDVVPAAVPDKPDREFLMRHLPEAEILITSWGTASLAADLLPAAEKLRLVGHAAGSVKPIMTEAAWQRGIRVTSGAPAIAFSVAEFCLGMMLMAARRVFWLEKRARQGHWRETWSFFGPAFEIYRQNVGVIGASNVGRRLIQLLQPFGCNVLLYDPFCSAEKARELGAVKVDALDDVFSRCRVVSLNAPVTEDTKGMIRGRHFAMLQPGSLFINTARWVIINHEEMLAELRRGRFIACLDVAPQEPPPLDDELRRLPNVVLTPHQAGGFAENLMRVGEQIAEDVAAYLEGRPLVGEVTADRMAIIA